jgi:hypothetical protein
VVVSPSGRTTTVTFGCASLWARRSKKPTFTAADGTTYTALTGRLTPKVSIYDYDVTLTNANAACIKSDGSRALLLWLLIILGVVALLGDHVWRRWHRMLATDPYSARFEGP